MPELQKTALNHLHHKLGAKMVAFAGYQMPVQYSTGIIQEHLHCRKQAGFFDISHMGQYMISGANVAQELEKLVPSDICGLQIGQQRYTVLCNESGGIIDDIIITRTESDFLLVVNAACKEKDFAHLQHRLSKSCKLEKLNGQALFALQGPAAAHIMSQLSPTASTLSFMHACNSAIVDIPCLISRCGYTGEDGFEISVANSDAEAVANVILNFAEVAPIGLGARDTLRLEAGLSLYGHELSEDTNPIEAGLKWVFRKQIDHCLGAEFLLPLLSTGAEKKRIGLLVEGKAPPRQHCELFDQQNHYIGVITSGSFSPSLGRPIAIAFINRTFSEETVYAKVRGRKISASITRLPFVLHRYHRT